MVAGGIVLLHGRNFYRLKNDVKNDKSCTGNTFQYSFYECLVANAVSY